MNEQKPSLHEACVEAVNIMIECGIEKHVSYISTEDRIRFELDGVRIPKVTIEWVDATEAEDKE